MKDNFHDRLEEMLWDYHSELWSIKQQDDYMSQMDTANDIQKIIDELATALTQLFKDYIEDSKPDGMSEDLIRIAMNGKPPDAHDEWTPQESAQLSKAWNQALQQYKSNLLEGLSDE